RVAEQQAQIDQLREVLAQQSRLLDALSARTPVTGAPKLVEVESAAPMAPAATLAPEPVFQAAAAPPSSAAALDNLTKSIESIRANLGGFRFSGDFRYRLDLQLRSGNQFAGPLQNTRGRYR